MNLQQFKYLIITCNILFGTSLMAQNVILLKPDETHINDTNEGQFILVREEFEYLLKNESLLEVSSKRINLLQDQVAVLQQKCSIADSAISISQLHSKFWYDKLLETDKKLEYERIARTQFWNSRTFWFVVGSLTTVAIVSTK